MTLLHISDTHGMHSRLGATPPADVLVHSGDFTHGGTENEVLDFLNWFIALPYSQKIFVVGNHDLCLRDALDIKDLPENVHFLQDRSVTINDVTFFGLGYDHPEELIPNNVDILVTHEPPSEILDYSSGIHWGNIALRRRIETVKPHFHLFGHAHEAYGIQQKGCITFCNTSLLNDRNQLVNAPRLLNVSLRFF